MIALSRNIEPYRPIENIGPVEAMLGFACKNVFFPSSLLPLVPYPCSVGPAWSQCGLDKEVYTSRALLLTYQGIKTEENLKIEI